MAFKDHFSRQSLDYAKYRPHYPDALFQWLATLTVEHEHVWDVGTGSGQAALALAQYYRHVTATDPAEAQIRNAVAHERITYKVMTAEQTDLAPTSVDLITVAQALHWFDFERFYREAQRVVKPGGVIAAWGYGLHRISTDIDPLLQHYYRDVVGPYWPPERQHIDALYRSIPFPFPEIDAPEFAMAETWTFAELIGYLGTWSATQRYTQAQGHDPLPTLRERLQPLWGAPTLARAVSWPIYFRVGRIEQR